MYRVWLSGYYPGKIGGWIFIIQHVIDFTPPPACVHYTLFSVRPAVSDLELQQTPRPLHRRNSKWSQGVYSTRRATSNIRPWLRVNLVSLQWFIIQALPCPVQRSSNQPFGERAERTMVPQDEPQRQNPGSCWSSAWWIHSFRERCYLVVSGTALRQGTGVLIWSGETIESP